MHSLYYLLFGLGLLHHLSAHFDSRGEHCTGEVCHVDALQVADLLGGWREQDRRVGAFKSDDIFYCRVSNIVFKEILYIY